jgi:hypothetical protein
MVGDKVIITRRAESYEGGWPDIWVDKMKTFGEDLIIHTITKMHDTAVVCGEFNYPFFVLMPVSQAEVNMFRKIISCY